MKLKFQAILDLLLELNYLAVIFFIPLWFAYLFPTYGIFEFNKIIIFRILVCLFLGLTLLKIIFCSQTLLLNSQRVFLNPLAFFKKYFLVPALFLFGLGITLFFSIDLNQSFWGSFNRQQGWLSFLYYFLWFILLVFNILTINNQLVFSNRLKRLKSAQQPNLETQVIANNSTKKIMGDTLESRVRRLIITATISGSIVAVYGILQSLGIDFLNWAEPAFLTKRIFSTLGQPNFLASYLLLIIPLSVYLAYSSQNFLKKFLYFLGGASQLLALFLTGSRAAVLAFFLGFILFLVYLLIFKIGRLKKRLISLGLGLFILISVLGGAISLSPERFRNIFDFQAGSVALRSFFYQAAAQAILEKPVFGYGLENSGEVLIRYYEPSWGIYNKVGASTDRVHNLVLDIILTSGFWGLLCFIALYYWFFKLAGDNLRQKISSALSLALMIGIATYLLSLLFNFSIITGEIYFWSFAALIIVLNYSVSLSKELEDSPVISNRSARNLARFNYLKKLLKERQLGLGVSKFLAICLVVVLIIWGISRNFQMLEADHYFNELIKRAENQEVGPALILSGYIRELDINSSQQAVYDRYLGHYLSKISQPILEKSLEVLVVQAEQKILTDLPEQGFENLLVKAEVAGSLGKNQLASDYLKAVKNISPQWPLVYLAEADWLVGREDWLGAREAYVLANSQLPDLNSPYINEEHKQNAAAYKQRVYQGVGDTYFQEKNYIAAGEFYQQAYRYDIFNLNLLSKIADVYYQQGDLDKALRFNQHGFVRSPKDYHWPWRISLIYQAKGETELADYYQKIVGQLQGVQ